MEFYTSYDRYLYKETEINKAKWVNQNNITIGKGYTYWYYFYTHDVL